MTSACYCMWKPRAVKKERKKNMLLYVKTKNCKWKKYINTTLCVNNNMLHHELTQAMAEVSNLFFTVYHFQNGIFYLLKNNKNVLFKPNMTGFWGNHDCFVRIIAHPIGSIFHVWLVSNWGSGWPYFSLFRAIT